MSGTVSLLPPAEQQFCDANGAPLAGGSVATYIPGTTTPSTTWQDSAGTVPNANPIVLDAAGRAIIWGNGAYRMVVKDVSGNLIFDQVTSGASQTTPSLDVTGNATIGGTLTVDGATTLAALTAGSITTTGTVDAGVLAVTQVGGTTAQPSALTLTRTGNLSSDQALLRSALTFNNASGSAFPAANQSYSSVTINGAPTQGLWAQYDTLNFAGANTIATNPPFVSRYVEAVISDPMGGGSVSPQAWALIASLVDKTNLPSSQAGLIRTLELDMEASGADDHSSPPLGRVILSLVGFPGRSYGGTDTQIGNALNINQSGGSSGKFSFHTLINAGGTFTGVGLDLSSAVAVSNAPAIMLAPNQRIMLDGTNGTGGVSYLYSDGVTAHFVSTNLSMVGPTGFSDKVGFNGTAPVAKPTVTGSRGGNAALASLLTALAAYGLVTDGTTT